MTVSNTPTTKLLALFNQYRLFLRCIHKKTNQIHVLSFAEMVQLGFDSKMPLCGNVLLNLSNSINYWYSKIPLISPLTR